MSQDVTMQNDMASTVRSLLLRLAPVAIVFLFALLSRAGGPKCVAGTSYFDPTMTGQPLLWPQGLITYYTDQGDLSSILPNASANTFVANAFSLWTSVPTAALGATRGGQLAEDVNGSNVTVNSDGTISIPFDIQSSATGTPIGVVYDSDGAVTNALIGAGAGDSSQCFYNAAFGGTDNYGSSAIYQHALVVINGQCAQQSSQLVDLEYRLVRVLGTVLGLGWSQVNPNVITGKPPASSDDYAGFPVMHYTDPVSCSPITRCYANPYQLAMDDAAAISRLYPVTAQNRSSFPGKRIFSSSTARIHGSVWFTDRFGNPTQPMQGVNVVARWIDPTTKQPSGRYAASSVSGFLFTGNEGNPITGFNDELGEPYDEWGSDNSSLEGFFDLAGLQLPAGTAQYQLTVEPLDPIWSAGVEPYAPFLVTPSGLAQAIVLTVSAGQDVQQDILMQASAQPVPPVSTETWTSPAAIPPTGDWMGSLSGYGNIAYFLMRAQANRTLSVTVKALDEFGYASEAKSQPVVGMWSASDPEGTSPPAFTPSSFNSMAFGITRLDAQVNTPSNFLVGIADLRGDGRPDYHYEARVLYADSLSPPRVSVAGGPVTVLGTGFSQGLAAAVGNATAPPLSINSQKAILAVPPLSDGLLSVTLTDPATGGSTTMTNALTVGAAASDDIILLSGLNPRTPVGTQAANPVIVRVLQADGATPVAGATVGWSAGNSLQLSACNGSSSCSVQTDQYGEVATWLTPASAGAANVTATLAPGVYSPSKSVSAALSTTQPTTQDEIGVPAFLWIAQGATLSVPLTTRVVSNGNPQNSVTVNFTNYGAGTLSAASAQTNASGYATVMLSLTQFGSSLQVSACVGPGPPCQTFYGTPVPASALQLLPVAGAGQVTTGAAFQPVLVRVTDSSTPPNPVLGASVTFLTTVLRPGGTGPGGGGGETISGNPAMPVILKVTQSSALSDANGLANVVPSSSGFSGPLEVDVEVTAGISASLDYPLQVVVPPASIKPTKSPPIAPPVRIRVPLDPKTNPAAALTRIATGSRSVSD